MIALSLSILVSLLFLLWEFIAWWKIDKYEFKDKFKAPIQFEGLEEVEESGNKMYSRGFSTANKSAGAFLNSSNHELIKSPNLLEEDSCSIDYVNDF